MRRPVILTVALVALVAAAGVAQVGRPVPEPVGELEGFSQTEARSFDQFFGRAVLLEFFAYW